MQQSRPATERAATLAALIATLRELALESDAMPTFGFLSLFFFLSAVSALSFNRTDGVFIAMCCSILTAILQSVEPAPAQPKIRYRDGYVYVVKSLTDHTHYKIGRTRDFHRRAKTFDVKLPFDVETICLIKTDDMYKLESELHDQFAHKRKQGEWFALDDEDIKWLKLFNQIGGTEQ